MCSIIKKPEGHFMVKTQKGEVYEARFVVNAAGVYADQISAMAGSGGFSIHPSKGSYYVLDKSQCSLVHSTIFQCPSKAGKGVLISPTVHGNLIVGPDAQEIQDREDTSCQQAQRWTIGNPSVILPGYGPIVTDRILSLNNPLKCQDFLKPPESNPQAYPPPQRLPWSW